MSLCCPHCLECPPIPLSHSLSGPGLGAIFGRRPSISLSSMFASFGLGLTSPRDSFMLVVLFICLPHGTRSSLGTELSLIHLWEPRCSCGPHRAGSSGTCLKWENKAGSRTFSEHACGSGPDEGGVLLPALGKASVEASLQVPLPESPIAPGMLPSDAPGWGGGGRGGCPWPSSWALKPRVGSLRAEPPSFFLSPSCLGQPAWFTLGNWVPFPGSLSLPAWTRQWVQMQESKGLGISPFSATSYLSGPQFPSLYHWRGVP